MSTEHLLFSIVLLLGFLFIIATLQALYLYKKHLNDYKNFLKDYRQCGLYVDNISNLAENFGFTAYYLKITFFVRLLKNKKMYIAKGKPVNNACYEYMHNVPVEKKAWMWAWRKAFLIQGTLFFMTIAFGFLHSIIYNY